MSEPTSTAGRSRRIAVLGPIPRDHIITHRGDVLEKYGCALYTAIALSALVGDEGEVLPIVNVADEDLEPIREILADYENITFTGVRPVGDRGDVVELRFIDQNNRLERQTGYMAPITPADVEFALDADAFVCVPITDYEVSQSTLEHIRAASSGVILLDGHGPTTSISHGGERVRRLWVDMDAWLPSIDILKMNLEEAGCSWLPGPGDDRAPGDPVTMNHLADFAGAVLAGGVRALCVTLDEEGCVAYTLNARGELMETIVPRVPVEQVIDTTGCGDSFAAGMAFGYLLGGDILTACRYGNAMGAQRAAADRLDGYRDLASTTAQIEATYGA